MKKFATNSEFFDGTYAEKAHHQQSFNERIITDLADSIIRWFPDTSNQPLKILDLCCGHGEPTFNLLKQLDAKSVNVAKIVGYDSSTEQIEKANKFCSKDSRLSFVLKNVEEMTDENEFDIIISLFGLHWMNDINDIAKKIHKAIKPNGKLLFFVPLEKMDLFEIRKEFMRQTEWKEFFNNFTIHPFIKNEKGYTEFFDNYFDAEQVIRGKATKIYSEQEFASFLSSWLQEIRHLSSNGIDKEKCDEYAIELTKSIPENRISHNVTRFKTGDETKVRFVEKFLSYQGSQKFPVAVLKEKQNIQQEKSNGRILLNIGVFAALTTGMFALKENNSDIKAPTCNIL